MDSSFHFTAAGERLHCRIGREVDPKETEKLLEEPPEGENGALTPDSPTATRDIESIANTTKNSTHTITLASPKENSSKFFFLRYFYPSSETDGKAERITPFAVALLIVLLAVYVLNQADRLVLAVVIPSGLRCGVEKDDCPGSNSSTNTSTETDGNSSDVDCIQFNDDQQGLLTGPAFILIYVLAGLPLARLADTRSRPVVLVLGLAFWSVIVLVTGFTKTFWQLLLLRILLGIGEASCNPVAYSLLADFFPPQHRAIALSIYHYGVYLGGGLGWMIGAVNDSLSWRWAFHILGIAGLVLVPVASLAMWEPASVRNSRKKRQSGKASYSIKEVILYLITNPPFLFLLVAASIRNIPGYALGAWLPTFFKRNYGVSDYGIPVGLVIMFGGFLGSILGGFISDRLSSWWRGSKSFVIAVSQVLAAPCIIAVLVAPTPQQSYGLLFLAYVTAETWLGPAAAIVQDVCMPAMRAQASAVYIAIITIVASIGPVLVPALLDWVSSFYRCGSGVKYALLVIVPSFYLCSALLFLVLGVVTIWWEHRRRGRRYSVLQASEETTTSTVSIKPST